MPDTLAQRVRAKYPGVYDDLSDAELESRVVAKFPGVYDDLPRTEAAPPAAPDTGDILGSVDPENAVAGTSRALQDLPLPQLAGAAASAPFTGGASILAAAAGGGAGGALQRFLRGENVTGGAVADAATEGATQTAGLGLARGASKLGHFLFKSALRPSLNIRREFGDVAQTGLREGIPVSEAGTDTAARATSASRTEAMRLLQEQAGDAPPVTADEIVPALRRAIDTAMDQRAVGENPNLQSLKDRLVSLNRTFGPGVDLPTAQRFKETSQDLASTAFRAQDKGAVINSLDALANQDTAHALQRAIEARVPGIQGQNARTRELLGLLRSLEDAELRTETGVPGLGTLINRLAMNPGVLSRAGIAADRGGRASPTMLRALMALLDEAQPPDLSEPVTLR